MPVQLELKVISDRNSSIHFSRLPRIISTDNDV